MEWRLAGSEIHVVGSFEIRAGATHFAAENPAANDYVSDDKSAAADFVDIVGHFGE